MTPVILLDANLVLSIFMIMEDGETRLILRLCIFTVLSTVSTKEQVQESKQETLC